MIRKCEMGAPGDYFSREISSILGDEFLFDFDIPTYLLEVELNGNRCLPIC